ncbi:sigma-70 family RNA polymerase sigma factor [Periweissella fabalis]|uniref:FliA/WhiG family RNA polymerase sigma factor n=1 Tax=Periweissella fabalis TaxID=1070421 RepID=A0A7X6S2G9_9LACO|nr:FliA/WhiG family RNA polymerase sigma factor [Periweissella fabalis]MCM0599940.1 FliA/WhiG family RNA polymerase sigma factor [Periweissella fabalis]NKZ24005.1 FliA/WhiG family RNA polymerase sigma factor [Periweissella fabalis]
MYEIDVETKILSYLPLVQRVVNRLALKNFDYSKDDLFNIGVIGLIDAIHKFDPTKKVPFEAYATFRIKGSIIDEVRKHAKISRNRMAILNQFYVVKHDLTVALEREPSDDEIARKMQITNSQLSDIYDSMHFLASVSLDATLFSGNNSEGFSLKEVLPDTTLQSSDERLEDDEQRQVLKQKIKLLPERDQVILNLYYVDNLTLKEIAVVLDVSIARVSQLHGKIIAKLKTMIEEELA